MRGVRGSEGRGGGQEEGKAKESRRGEGRGGKESSRDTDTAEGRDLYFRILHSPASALLGVSADMSQQIGQERI